MDKINIGILREGKIPIDKRVPLTPRQCLRLEQLFPEIKIIVQKSQIRCFADKEYENEGIEIADNLLDCDILLGVKEVPTIEFIENKTYAFFSHTIKEQAYNREMLREILRKKIRLIDYECLTNENGIRVIAFGRYAGIVGAYNGVFTYGKRFDLFNLRRAKQCYDLEDLKKEFKNVLLPAIKIVLTGTGRVAQGASEVLEGMGILKVQPDDFLGLSYEYPVYTMIDSDQYHKNQHGTPFPLDEFFKYPEQFKSDFKKYAVVSDLLINASFWAPAAPVLFTREDMMESDFKIKVIADISCDINGPIPSTMQASSIDHPVYDYDPRKDLVLEPYSGENFITVMAIDNLPCELPIDSSTDFGNQLTNYVIPGLLGDDPTGMIERATITKNGHLTTPFEYLQNYVEGIN